jgi:hypothetical protein
MNDFEVIPFKAFDDLDCNLIHYKGKSTPTKGPVLLVHGAGVRANIFNPPTQKNIIAVLLDEGYDVWLENWRASIDLPPNEWDLDKVALNDHPAAVQKIVELTGAQEIKAIIHCQGSTSFMISAVLGLVPEVKVIISNAVSLHPVVPSYAVFKLNVFVPFVRIFFRYLNPRWGLVAPDLKSKILRLIVRFSHREADTLVGKFVSFTYGAGFPALWRLENIDEPTKEWIQHEFAEVPLRFFNHIKACVKKGSLVSFNEHSDYTKPQPKTAAKIILFAGEQNQCFMAQSQQNTYNYLNALEPNRHKLYIMKGYSHLDIFLGKNSHKDIFPIMINELNNN